MTLAGYCWRPASKAVRASWYCCCFRNSYPAVNFLARSSKSAAAIDESASSASTATSTRTFLMHHLLIRQKRRFHPVLIESDSWENYIPRASETQTDRGDQGETSRLSCSQSPHDKTVVARCAQ